MAERLYVRPCPCCSVELNITLETDTDDISISSPQLAPLVRDKQRVVDAYRRVKKLPLSWDKAHRARALVIAGDIIAAFPPMPQIVDNAVLLLEWMALKNTKWDLGDCAAKIHTFLQYQRIVKEAAKRPYCGICGEQFFGTGNRCKRHEGMEG